MELPSQDVPPPLTRRSKRESVGLDAPRGPRSQDFIANEEMVEFQSAELSKGRSSSGCIFQDGRVLGEKEDGSDPSTGVTSETGSNSSPGEETLDETNSKDEELSFWKDKVARLEESMIQNEEKVALLQDSKIDDEVAALKKSLVELQEWKEEHTAFIQPSKPDAQTNEKEVESAHRLPLDAYSFIFWCSSSNMPMLIGVSISILQFLLFGLFLYNILGTFELPKDVEIDVTITQGVAIFVSFLAQEDLRTALVALMHQEGAGALERQEVIGFSRLKFYATYTLMGLQGLLGQVVGFMLILYSDNVFDLILNFTAIGFISQLDEIVFHISGAGFMGRGVENAVRDIESFWFIPDERRGSKRYLHIYLLLIQMAGFYTIFGYVVLQQNSHDNLPQVVKVEFGDEIDPSLGTYSGCYGIDEVDGINERVEYSQMSPARSQGSFHFCRASSFRTWTFTNEFASACSDKGTVVRSSSEERTTSFDLLDTKGDEWLLETGNPIESIQLVEVDLDNVEIKCGNLGWGDFGNSEPCFSLIIDVELSGFSGSHDWSRNFELLMSNEGRPVQFYQHPVYVGEFSDFAGFELVFFTGRRWVLISTRALINTDYPLDDLTGVVSWFERDDPWLLELPPDTIAFVSESVDQASDQGTPLGLRWFSSRYTDSNPFPSADISRPSDTLFRCGQCNDRTNPCSFEGECSDDGACRCMHGASGKLCEVKPVGDGACNLFFNTGADSYDGGDCCVATCALVSCGVGDAKYAFGKELLRDGIGYPYCTDPSMVPLTIHFSTSINVESLEAFSLSDSNNYYDSYGLEVKCKNGQEILLKVGIDPSVEGESDETIHAADQSTCSLSFLNIQSWSGLNVSYQIFDGQGAIGDDSSFFMGKGIVTTDKIVELPTLYKRCLKQVLANDAVLPELLYSGSYQDEAIAWLNNDTSGGSDCTRSSETLIERYALLAISFAEQAPASAAWTSPTEHCQWPRVTCDGDRVVDLSYGKHLRLQHSAMDIAKLTLLGCNQNSKTEIRTVSFRERSLPSLRF
jgi:hypothetical protein